TAVHPLRGSAHGGTPVNVSGSGFIDSLGLLCRFGDMLVAPEAVYGTTSVLCRAPPPKALGAVPVAMTNNGADFADPSQGSGSALTFTYVMPPTVTGMSPNVGPVCGSTVDGGSSFRRPSLFCRFGSAGTVPAVVESDGTALCVSPAAGAAGAVGVELTLNGIDLTATGRSFYYVPEPRFVAIRPAAGPELGGTEVVVTGSNFDRGAAVICQFGSAAHRVPARFVSPEAVTCVAPPHQPGLAEFRLSVDGQQFILAAAAAEGAAAGSSLFQYLVRWTVTMLRPAIGPAGGGTGVVVSGTGFINATELACSFGSRTVPATFLDSSHVRCVAPPQADEAAMDVPVDVTNNGVDFSSNGVAFGYLPMLRIENFSPSSGPVDGGTDIGIEGAGFGRLDGTPPLCIIGGISVSGRWSAAGGLICTTPAATAPVTASLAVSANGGADAVTAAGAFTYYLPARTTAVHPSLVPDAGGTALLVMGSNFIAGI
ncbi:unnamed protein product, partial [Phaeothamnion confervicola]